MKPRALGPSQAYVLHQYDWSESSLIVELFTREHGRLAVVAKGAKKPHSNWRPVLVPFQRLTVNCTRSAQEEVEVHNLRSVEWAGPVASFQGATLFSAYYLNELLLKLLARADAQTVLFDAYHQTLPAVAHGQETHAQAALRAFEALLLREMGWLPDLACDTLTQQPLAAQAHYALDAENGLRAAKDEAAALPGHQWLALEQALASRQLSALQAACLPGLPNLRGQLRGPLHYHLGVHELRTRRLLADVHRLTLPPHGRQAAAR
jgi:DNA repair protein RecO (recombination protein O)